MEEARKVRQSFYRKNSARNEYCVVATDCDTQAVSLPESRQEMQRRDRRHEEDGTCLALIVEKATLLHRLPLKGRSDRRQKMALGH